MNLNTMFGSGSAPNYAGPIGFGNPYGQNGQVGVGTGTGTADPGAGPFGPGGIIGTVKDMYGDSQQKTLDYLSGLTGDANTKLQGGLDQSNASFGQGQGYLSSVMNQLPGMYSQSNAFFGNLMSNGMYKQGEIDSILGGAYQAANQASRTQGANLNQALAARGMGANPYAAAALGMQGQFAAQGARGQALANVTREQAGSRITGAQGHSANAQAQGGQMSGLAQAQAGLSSQQAQAQLLAAQGMSGNLMNQAGMGSQYRYGNNQSLAQLLSQLGLNMAGQATTPTSDATGGMLPTTPSYVPPNGGAITW